MNTNHVRCLVCDENYKPDQTRQMDSCLKCGNNFTPINPEKDVDVKINWSEMVMLLIWAAAHTRREPITNRTLKAITERIRQQHPQLYAESQVNFI